MLYVGWTLDSARTDPLLAWDSIDLIKALALSTAAAVVGLALMFVNMNKSHRVTFIEIFPLKTYISELW